MTRLARPNFLELEFFMRRLLISVVFITTAASWAAPVLAQPGRYMGNLTANPYLPPAPPQPPGTFNNPYGNSATSPQIYDSQGQFRGNLNSNRYDPDSVANPYGRYGSKYSPDSINNPYGAGSRYGADSPNNPYGQGMGVYGR
jgi:hypothetical protein